MKGNELIEKILNKEIKSGTMIKMKSNYPNLEWEKELCFNGNWFSEGKYEVGCSRYDDIILHLCSEYITFEIIEEEKKIPEKLKIINSDSYYDDCYYEKLSKEEIALDLISLKKWINLIIDYLKSKGE